MAEEQKPVAQGGVVAFQRDWLQLWRSLPMRWPLLALLGAWLALFHFLGNSTLGYVRTPSLSVGGFGSTPAVQRARTVMPSEVDVYLN